MSKYVKREIFEAIQFTGKNKFEKLLAFLPNVPFKVEHPNEVQLDRDILDTEIGASLLTEGDFVVKVEETIMILSAETFTKEFKKLRS